MAGTGAGDRDGRAVGARAVIASVTLFPSGQTPPGGTVVPPGQVGVFFNLSSGG
jgi:hypothetical protein